jgi:hypothetical protein
MIVAAATFSISSATGGVVVSSELLQLAIIKVAINASESNL